MWPCLREEASCTLAHCLPACSRDQPSLEWLLSDEELLHRLHLPEDWHVPPTGDKTARPERAFGLMPFQVGGEDGAPPFT